jgi:hypothetical protein
VVVRDRQQDALSRSGLHPGVGLLDAVQVERPADRDRKGSVVRRGGQVFCGSAPGVPGEVVAAEQPDRHVGEEHGPEREARAIVSGRIRGDDGIGCGDRGVEVRVVGEGDLDDAMHAVGCERPDRLRRLPLVERDRMCRRRIDSVDVA